MSSSRQDGIGWLAPIVALAGLCLALAGARGWGESPKPLPLPDTLVPANDVHKSNGHRGHDAGVPDAAMIDGTRLVGMLHTHD